MHRTLSLQPGTNRFWKRLIIFSSVFIISATMALVYNFTRPPIYIAGADLLIEPKNPNHRGQDTSTYDIALQSRSC